MPNAIVRATARTLPDVTSRRSVLGAVLAAGAVAVPALPSFASVETPALSAVDRRVLDLWNRRRRLRAALDRLSERIDAAAAQMPKWARSGPKYVLAKGEIQIPGVTHAAGDVGWPEVADLEQQPVGALGWILVRPNVGDLYVRFQADCRAGNREDGTHRFLQALIAHVARVKDQKAEKDRVGYGRLNERIEAGWDKMFDIRDAIRKHTEASVLAVGASLLISIEADDDEDDVLQNYLAFLRALRPQLVGAIAEDADRVLVEKSEEAA